MLKNNLYSFFHERHCTCPVLTYFLYLDVWLKDHVIFDIELGVKWREFSILGRDVERYPETCEDSVSFLILF